MTRDYFSDRIIKLYLKEIARLPPISIEEEEALTRRIKEGDQEAFHDLIRANLRFVITIAKQYQNQGVPMVDLINEGNYGLIKAARRFDETRGFKFISYAVWWIRQAMLQALSDQGRIIRIPINRTEMIRKINRFIKAYYHEHGHYPGVEEISEKLEMPVEDVWESMNTITQQISLDAPLSDREDKTLADVLEDTRSESPAQELFTSALKDQVDEVLTQLTEREAEVIRYYFGIDLERSYTLEEIGSTMDLTRERVRQIKERGLKKLRYVSRSSILRAFFER